MPWSEGDENNEPVEDKHALFKAGFEYWNSSEMTITEIETATQFERWQVYVGQWINYFASKEGIGWVHAGLDIVGMIPVIGSVADVLNAGVYFYEGKYAMMVLNLGTAVTGLSGVPVAKWGSNGVKAAEAATKTSKISCMAGALVKVTPHAAIVVAAGYEANESFSKGEYLAGTLHIVTALTHTARGVKAFKNAKFCFTEGTQIVVGMNYDEYGNFANYDTKNIEDIQVGDLVYSYNTLTGETELTEVTQTFALRSDHINYLTVVDEDGNEQTLETTDSHPFWVVTDDPDLERAAREVVDENGVWLYHEGIEPAEHGYWVEAKDLRVGDVFLGANGELSTLTNIVRVEQEGGIAVFNFTVDGNHNYFILAKEYEYGQTCVLVHNAKYDKIAGVRNRGPRLGQKQGREFRTETLQLHEFDSTMPKHIRGWLKNERRMIEYGNRTSPRNPPGYVLAHGRTTPAREGFDYSNSRLQLKILNDLEERIRRRFGH